MNVNCIILAGGRGLRLGHDKVFETVGNRSLLEQVISCVSSVCDDVIIVTAPERTIPQLDSQSKLRILNDIYPGKGPLIGIYTGLAASNSFYNLVVASDMPFLNRELLSYMIGLAPDFDAVVPRLGKLVEPLHAVYSKSCLTPIEKMMEQDKLNVYELLDLVKARYVEADEIDELDPQHLSFFNINTRVDLQWARELAGGEFINDKC